MPSIWALLHRPVRLPAHRFNYLCSHPDLPHHFSPSWIQSICHCLCTRLLKGFRLRPSQYTSWKVLQAHPSRQHLQLDWVLLPWSLTLHQVWTRVLWFPRHHGEHHTGFRYRSCFLRGYSLRSSSSHTRELDAQIRWRHVPRGTGIELRLVCHWNLECWKMGNK